MHGQGRQDKDDAHISVMSFFDFHALSKRRFTQRIYPGLDAGSLSLQRDQIFVPNIDPLIRVESNSYTLIMYLN